MSVNIRGVCSVVPPVLGVVEAGLEAEVGSPDQVERGNLGQRMD